MSEKQVVKLLQGEKVYLRPFSAEEDLDVYFKALFNPEGRRLTGMQVVHTKEQVHAFFQRIADDNTRVDLIICAQDSDEAVGDIAVNSIDFINRSANLRIAIFEAANYSKGYGTEALRLMLDHAFGILNLHRIELDVFVDNKRAVRAYEKAGFQIEGVKRDVWFQNHEYRDMYLMSILAHEYRA